MKQLLLSLFILFVLNGFAQQPDHSYTMHIRTQAYDSTGYCNCPQDDNGSGADCNSIGGAMIIVYTDTLLYSNFYTDETGYCPTFSLPYGKYKIVINEKHHKSVSVMVDFTAADRRRNIIGSKGSYIHYRTQITDYFICVMMEGRKKDGVKIIPKDK